MDTSVEPLVGLDTQIYVIENIGRNLSIPDRDTSGM
jgi:hypothetical protein